MECHALPRLWRRLMPRGPRLDAPGVLHHVMARGIERSLIFRDVADREAFLRRLGEVVAEADLDVFAWALLPNHFHLLLRTAGTPLPAAMRCLLSGHATWFNRRHERVGHLFQNRFKSVVCEEDPYFLELVRYIHLNPLRAGIVSSIKELEGYPYAGHSAVLGTIRRGWHRTAAVLRSFGGDELRAIEAYRRFVAAAAELGTRPELAGGGLIRSAGGWAAVRELRKGRECFAHDERVLGGPDFVEALRRTKATYRTNVGRGLRIQEIVALVCRSLSLDGERLLEGGRPRAISRAREGIAFLWIAHFGRSGHEAAAVLGISPTSAYRCAQRAQCASEAWLGLLKGDKK
jgi:putative transposase